MVTSFKTQTACLVPAIEWGSGHFQIPFEDALFSF
jgi:hypothetical protein